MPGAVVAMAQTLPYPVSLDDSAHEASVASVDELR